MYSSSRVALKQTSAPPQQGAARLMVHACKRGQEPEVLSFLDTRPLHTVFMRGLIRDNGLDSPRNRGAFYACRDWEGQLQGVALIGHATLFEARYESAILAFVNEAQKQANIHMLIGEQEPVEVFWKSYVRRGQQLRHVCRELLLEQQAPIQMHGSAGGLRLATIEDLGGVMSIQSQMAFAESGVDPIEVDRAGFQRRCTQRIEQGRVWVSVEKEKLMFKADVMFETADVIYLEGIYVDPNHRGNGYGLKCLTQLSAALLTRTKSLCLLVNSQCREAQAFYMRAGFTLRSSYSTIFLEPRSFIS